MSELNTLNISDNQISSLQPSDFEGLDNLELLFAHDNKIRVVPDDLFLHNPALLQVSLQNNQLTQLGTFGEHPNLIVLRLDNNYLTDFGVESPFVHMKSLQYLFLDQNNLSSITPNMFPPTLHNLVLNENDISYIHGESFKDLPNINSVSLMFNKYVLSIMLVTVSRFNKHNPKPTFYIGGNVFLCDCFMGYMKFIQEDGYSRYAFNVYYPRFRGLETSSCMTPYEGNAVRPMSEVPLSHFVCSYNETYCDVGCDCCFDSGHCDCALTCPGNCECFSGGFTLKKGYIHIHCGARNLTFIPDEIPSRTVTLHLDGNNFTSFSKLGLSHLRDTEVLYLNGSHIETIEDGAFDNISALAMLHLEHNLLSAISEHLFGNLAHLKQIFLHNNLISKIAPNAFSALLSVETITLHNNRLTLLESVPTVPTLLSMTLSKNPWTCSCNITSANVILKVFRTLSRIIVDKERMCCHGYHRNRVSANGWAENISNHDVTPSNRTGQNMEDSDSLSGQGSPRGSTEDCFPLMHFRYEDMCIEPSNSTHLSAVSRASLSSGVIALIITTVMLVVLAVAVVVILVRRQELQAWAFVQLGIRVFDKKAQIDKEDAGTKAFDAFISYSSKDDEFVATTLVPALEEGNRRYRVCVHYRDFPVGQTIADTIVRAIENSSRTILLLSENFLHSEWCRFEFQTAHRHILREGSHRLIIVILGEVKEDMLDPDLKVHMKSKTYLKFDDPWFWEKLYFALPDTKGREQNEEERNMDVLRGMRILAGQEDNTHEVKGREQPHGAELAEHEPEVKVQVCHEDPGKKLKDDVNLKKMLDKDFTDIYDIFPKKKDVNIFHVDDEDVNLNVYKGNKWEENENRRRGHFQDKESNVDKQFENSVNEENDHIVNGLDRCRPTVTIESHVDCENGKNDTNDEDGDSLREKDNNIVPQVVKHPSCDNSTEVKKKVDDNSTPCSSIDSGILVSCSEEQPLKSSDKILECSTDSYNCNIVSNDDIEQNNYQHDDVIDDYDQHKDTLDNDDVEQTYPCSELDKDDIEQTYPYFVDNGCEVSFINGQQGTNLGPVSKDSELTICKVTNTLQNEDKRVMTTDLDLLKEEIV